MSITDADRVQVAARARAQVGKPYVYGADGPAAYDCSGSVKDAWSPFLVLPHNSSMLATSQDLPDNVQLVPAGRKVGGVWPYKLLKLGDYALYYGQFIDPSTISHVAVYVGDEMIVNATNEARGVEQIELAQYAKPVGYGLVR